MQSLWRVACVRIPRFPIGAVWRAVQRAGSGTGGAGAQLLLPFTAPPTPSSSSPNGSRSCTSLAPRSPRRAARHTAPIGNLGMRTQATRHSNCTADLHDSVNSSASHSAAPLLHDNGHASLADGGGRTARRETAAFAPPSSATGFAPDAEADRAAEHRAATLFAGDDERSSRFARESR